MKIKKVAELIVKVPALLIKGDKDYVLRFPAMEEYIRNGKVQHFVLDLEIVHLTEDCPESENLQAVSWKSLRVLAEAYLIYNVYLNMA